MNQVLRWTIAVVAALVIVGLIAFARGTAHHRGTQVGSTGHAAAAATVRSLG